MYLIELFLLFVVAIVITGISTYALVDWWRRKKAAEPYPVREIPQMLSMMEMEDGSFVLRFREGPTTHIDDAFDGVKFIFTGGYLKEIRAKHLDDLGAYLRENGGFYEAPVLLNELGRPPTAPRLSRGIATPGRRRGQ
jgi:hypothetical protein